MDELLDRFCRYVKVETTSAHDAVGCPSTPGQLELGRLIAEELRGLGLADVGIDEYGLVTATVPGNVEGAPTIAWLAHLDTSPDASGKGVQPTIHRNYDGQDIALAGDPSKVIRVAETDGLSELAGKTLITSDGTTLLGADDKAGAAVIMTAAATLMGDAAIEHGPIRVVFTVDEEIGQGTDRVDVAKLDATCAYTLDGVGEGLIENETFSADMATVTITGVSIHPGLAYGKMVNAIRVASEFVDRLPRDMAPETTEGRDGFLHVHTFEGNASQVKLQILLRSFVTGELETQAGILRDAAKAVTDAHPGAEVQVRIKRSYRNMADSLARAPRTTALAVQAFQNIGVEPTFSSLRGGTDGARLTEAGLPTPNLSTGMHNFHSPLEFACLEEMQTAVKMLLELARLWGAQAPA